VLGEEFGLGEGAGGDAQRARYRWVLDPIDGTLAFSRGLPTFGTLLAFEDVTEHRSLLGVIHLPAMGETYSAARGAGAWCGDRRIQVSPSRELSDCIISIPAEHHFRVGGIADRHAKFGTRFPHIRSFADCWAHAMVARGSIDAVAEFNLSRWDLAASEIIVKEAGGQVRLRETPRARGKYDCILGSPQAAAAVSEVLGF
jgi:histidinol-phosphatase